MRWAFTLASTLAALTLTGCEGESTLLIDQAEPPEEGELAFKIGTIPDAYQGQWDFETGSCTPESDAFIEISYGQIQFYESIGNLTFIAEEGDDIIVMLGMEGEGERWVQSVRLSLEGEGAEQRLHSSDGSEPKVEDEFPRRRCA